MLLVLVTFVTSLVHELGEDGRTSAELSGCFSCLSSYGPKVTSLPPCLASAQPRARTLLLAAPRGANRSMGKQNHSQSPIPDPRTPPFTQGKGELCSQPRSEHRAPSSWGCCRPPGLSPPPPRGWFQGRPRSPQAQPAPGITMLLLDQPHGVKHCEKPPAAAEVAFLFVTAMAGSLKQEQKCIITLYSLIITLNITLYSLLFPINLLTLYSLLLHLIPPISSLAQHSRFTTYSMLITIPYFIPNFI